MQKTKKKDIEFSIKELSIIIPAYNEEKRIIDTLHKINAYLEGRKIKYEIVVVDDGSRDRTKAAVCGMKNKKIRLIQNKNNMGKGYSVKRGLLNSRYRYALFTDADLSTPISEIEKFFPHLDKNDLVVGSRKTKNSFVVEKQPFYRVLAGNIFPLIVKIVINPGIEDTQCGFKIFRMVSCKKLIKKLTLNGFSFDVELIHIAKKKNLEVKEIGIEWYNNTESKVRLFRHSFIMLADLIKIKINEMKGLYD